MSKTVIVAGALANKPNNGGEAAVRLAWVRGFLSLGFRVCFIEQIDSNACVDADGQSAPFERSANLVYFRRNLEPYDEVHGLPHALVLDNGVQIHGADLAQLRHFAESADLLVNISGHLKWPELMSRIRGGRKVYVDIDPGYTQIWHEQGFAKLDRHDVYFTIGQNIGQPDCAIPTCGIDWKITRPPAVVTRFVGSPLARDDRFTTVAAWRGSFGVVTRNGVTYGQKAHEFRKVIDLPRRTPHDFEIALLIYPGDAKDRALLEEHRWRLANPFAVAATPEKFQRYVHDSSAEFSVAQGMYVQTNSGWFSDRTVQYLALGRPALVQETGFSAHFGNGLGIVPFRTLDEAVEGANRIVRDYGLHALHARRLAEQEFDSSVVLRKFLADASIEL